MNVHKKTWFEELLSPRGMAVFAVCAAIALFGIYNFISNGFLRQFQQPAWDFSYYYVAGKMWASQGDPYNLQQFQETFIKQVVPFDGVRYAALYDEIGGMVYPPALYWVATPLSQLPLQTATDLFAVLSLLLWVGGMALLGAVLFAYRALNLWSVSVLILLLGSISIRDTFQYGQINAVLFFSLIFSFFALQRGWSFWAGVALALVSIKPPVVVVLVLIFLVRRDFRFVLGAVIGIALVNLLPPLLLNQSVIEVPLEWLDRVGRFGGLNDRVNQADPTLANSALMVHMQVIVNRIFSQDSNFTHLLNTALIVLFFIPPLYLAGRFKGNKHTVLIDFALACSLGSTVFYTRWYGLYALFPGILVIYLHFRSLPDSRGKWLWGGWLLLVLGTAVVPNSLLFNPLSAIEGNYLVQLVLPYHAWVVFALTISLIILRWKSRSGSELTPAATAPVLASA